MHTKGPWVAEGMLVWDGVPAVVDWETDERSATLLVDASYAPGKAVCEANARLVAATPELLDALKNARQYVAAYAQNDEIATHALGVIDGVIAKAEGR